MAICWLCSFPSQFSYFPGLFVALMRSMKTGGKTKNPSNEIESFSLDRQGSCVHFEVMMVAGGQCVSPVSPCRGWGTPL